MHQKTVHYQAGFLWEIGSVPLGASEGPHRTYISYSVKGVYPPTPHLSSRAVFLLELYT